jgi:hypothetical protein
MTMSQPISQRADRVMAALVAGLELEFGRGAAEALAERFIAAEEADFTWDARHEERWLGGFEPLEESDFELDRVAVIGRGCIGSWCRGGVHRRWRRHGTRRDRPAHVHDDAGGAEGVRDAALKAHFSPAAVSDRHRGPAFLCARSGRQGAKGGGGVRQDKAAAPMVPQVIVCTSFFRRLPGTALPARCRPAQIWRFSGTFGGTGFLRA